MHAIEMSDVHKTYRLGEVDLHVLKGVNIKVRKGEFVSVTGPSGSGKSTMLHLMGGLDRPSKGRVTIEGTDVSDMNDNKLANVRGRKIGFVFQTFNLVSRLNAIENVMLPMWFADIPAPERNKKSAALLARVGLGHRLMNKPSQLSGGERQRVAIARALANDPEIVVADEPTGNLDSRTGEEIIDMLEEIHANGSTVILVTHDMNIASRAHRRVKMLDGKIVHDKG